MNVMQTIEYFYRQYAAHRHINYESALFRYERDIREMVREIKTLGDRARELERRVEEQDSYIERTLIKVRNKGEDKVKQMEADFAQVLKDQYRIYHEKTDESLKIIASNFNKLAKANVADLAKMEEQVGKITEFHNNQWRENVLPWLGLPQPEITVETLKTHESAKAHAEFE